MRQLCRAEINQHHEEDAMSDKMIVVRRPESHPKGKKTIAEFPYGEQVPPGVIIGKGSIITVETKTSN